MGPRGLALVLAYHRITRGVLDSVDWIPGGLAARLQELSQLRDRLLHQLGQSETDSVGALSSYDNHPADLGTDTVSREMDLGLAWDINQHIAQITRAMEKIRDGTYGVCDQCGRTIPADRLSAMPEAVYCLTCQAAQEPVGHPPIESQVIRPPYGSPAPGAVDSVEAEGEHFWSAVAAWGNSDTPQDTPPAIDYDQTFPEFSQEPGVVEVVEGLVDENGEVLWDAWRTRPHRMAETTSAESDETPS